MASSCRLFAVIFAILATVTAQHWNYHEIEKWAEVNEVCGTGRRQSPVHLISSETVKDPVLSSDPLVFNDYNRLYQGMLTNNGHTVQWSINATDRRPSISGSGLGSSYLFEQFHFHWSQSQCYGSEHVIDYRPAALEAHFVHRNSKYASVAEALTHDDGIAVVGFMFSGDESDNENDNDIDNVIDYSVVARKIPLISKPGTTVPAAISFAYLIPKWAMPSSQGTFFRYNGSLTTPPCTENVIWTVFQRRIPISLSDLNKFRYSVKMPDEADHSGASSVQLKFNYRNVQQLNDRQVFTNKK